MHNQVADELASKRLLIVDDSRTFVSLLRSIIRDMGIREIADALDPFVGLEFLETNPVDCITLDYVMPGLDGVAFVEKLRASTTSVNRLTPVILITGHADRRLIQNAVSAGIDEVLVKPLRPNVFMQRLRTTLMRPRDCVATASGYVGPDRRRNPRPDFPGEDRRHSEAHAVIARTRPGATGEIRVLKPVENAPPPAPSKAPARAKPAAAPDPDNEIILLE